MPRKCYIPGCNSNSGKFTHYTPVFSFPKEWTRRQRWFDIVRNEFKFITDDDPGVNACVCVHHFDPQYVEQQPQLKPQVPGVKYPSMKLRLVKDAVPTIFKGEIEVSKKKRTRAIRRFKKKFNHYNNSKQTTPEPKPSEEVIQRVIDEQIKISVYANYLHDYGPEYYNSVWDHNYRVLKESMDKTLINPLNWSLEKVADQITKTCQNADIGELFKDQEIDGSALLDLSKDDLQQLLGLKLGPSIKIATLIEKLRDQVIYKHIVTDDFDE